jgi:integrating conjugative element relaxase (TIGR03760 family)
LFHNQGKIPAASHKELLKDLTRTMPGQALLTNGKRPAVLSEIEALCALEETRYTSLCGNLMSNLANYFQDLPETTNSFYAEAGGLLDHALYRTESAMLLFKQFLVLDAAAMLSEEQKLWQYALYSAALLQGVGKLYVDYSINVFDGSGHMLTLWNPLTSSLATSGSYYNYTFHKDMDIDFRRRVNLLLAQKIIPASGFAWIASNAKVLAVWLALLQDDLRSAGTLGAILIRADALAIQRYYTEFLIKNAAIRNARQRQAGPFHAELPETLAEKEQILGLAFIQWLQQALADGRIILNQAPVFMVPGGMLMSVETYKLFVRENPEYKNWEAVQKSFLSLGLHAKEQTNGMARFEQTHTQKMHSGDVFVDYAITLPNTMKVHTIATGQTTTLTAVELVYVAQFYAQFTQIQSSLNAAPLQHLSSDGIWHVPEHIRPETQFGTGNRG